MGNPFWIEDEGEVGDGRGKREEGKVVEVMKESLHDRRQGNNIIICVCTV